MDTTTHKFLLQLLFALSLSFFICFSNSANLPVDLLIMPDGAMLVSDDYGKCHLSYYQHQSKQG